MINKPQPNKDPKRPRGIPEALIVASGEPARRDLFGAHHQYERQLLNR